MLIHLDIHGVLADFNGAFCLQMGIPFSPRDIPCEKTRYPLEYLGIPNLHEIINEFPVEFWRDIPLMRFAHLFVDGLQEICAVNFLSAPSNYKNSHEGILAWAEKNFPEIPCIVDNDKSWSKFLIDDIEENNPRILYPARWNDYKRDPNRRDISDILEIVEAEKCS